MNCPDSTECSLPAQSVWWFTYWSQTRDGGSPQRRSLPRSAAHSTINNCTYRLL